MDLSRRVFAGVIVVGAGVYWRFERQSRELERLAFLPVNVNVALFDDSGKLTGIAQQQRVRRSDDDWRKRLSVGEFQITRRADTELAFTGAYWNFEGDGLYRCVCCSTALFDSKTKYSSGTGWPSFTEPIAKQNIVELPDTTFGISRTAVACTLCEAHLGHVFDDGPPPGGMRYCMNSEALHFVARH